MNFLPLLLLLALLPWTAHPDAKITIEQSHAGSSKQARAFVGELFRRVTVLPAGGRAATVLPRNFDRSIDNFEANAGIIEVGYPGVLSAPPAQHPRPLEIVCETPALAPLDQQVEAHTLALEEILLRFRAVISEGQSI